VFWKALLLSLLALLLYGAYRGGLFELISTNPPAQFTYLGICVLYFSCGAPSFREGILAAAGGLAVVLFCPLTRPSDFPGEAWVRTGAFAGVGGLAIISARAILGRNRRAALDTLGHSLIFVVLGIVLGAMLRVASSLRPYKYDRILYSIDWSFGGPISFAMGRFFQTGLVFQRVELIVYYSLPLAFAILYAAHLRKAEPGRTDILMMMCLNAVVGYSLYLLYPAAGPAYAFGAAFPASPPAPHALPLQPLLLDAPPNAMPSLHMAGAVLIWWNARGWKPAGRLALVFMLLTALAALGTGEHYFLDLIVAFPYALAIQAAATRSDYRVPSLVLGIALTAWWFLALRLAPAELSSAPLWLMGPLATATVALPLIVNERLLSDRRPGDLRYSAEMEPAAARELNP